MKECIKYNLDLISKIWYKYMWSYQYCSSKIELDDDIEVDYFSDILGYFQDMLDVIFETKTSLNRYSEKFSYTISLLQAIFIQQDLVEEMLRVFGVPCTKIDLRRDSLYSLNRDLRNELIGHPINRCKGKLVSTVLFNYQAKEGEIGYFRFHKNNKFKSENRTFIICEIQQRHREFLEKYLSEVLIKLKTILDLYLDELDTLERKIFSGDLSTILKHTSLCFNTIIIGEERFYDVKNLLSFFSSDSEPEKCTDLKCNFYEDLKFAIVEKRKSVTATIQQIKTC